MTRRMLIDATHPEETRVVVVNGNRLEEFDYETTTKKQIKGNVYLAKVTRVEPSLQAAFVEYGGNRHGFLAFSEIHPDYYRIPVGDREELVDDDHDSQDDDDETAETGDGVEDMGAGEGVDEAVEEASLRRPRLRRQYKIQEVIKRPQVMLIQVVKEERGNKGAALTTYLSLAGRYCVVMPNTSRGGGVSRKIANVADRKRLKTILAELNVPEGMAIILRTAGAERSKAEVKRDFDYIMKLWDDIREKTLESSAPCLIHEEGNLIKRAIRDVYTKDIEEVLIAGDEGYRVAKDFMRALIPSHAKKVQPYKDDQGIPLLHRYQVEQQLAQIHEPTVQLRSGGSIVIHQTEALVAIDVNSGKSTRERHIEETALKTNLEAADEVARQLRLRDLAGLIVIDFIDMDENRNDAAVERRLKEALRRDRARIQVGRISSFGLMEMSRQRLRPSLIEAMSQPCPTCGGVGYIVSTESAALMVTRAIEEECLRRRATHITAKVPGSVALYVLNHKRASLMEMESRYGITITLEAVDGMLPPHYELTRTGTGEGEEGVEQVVERIPDRPIDRSGESSAPRNNERPQRPAAEGNEDRSGRKRSRRGGRRRGRRDEESADTAVEDQTAQANTDGDDEDTAVADSNSDSNNQENQGSNAEGGDGEDKTRRRRKRGRRGGRRRNRGREDGQAAEGQNGDGQSDSLTGQGETDGGSENSDQVSQDGSETTSSEAMGTEGDEKSRPPRRGRGRGRKPSAEAASSTQDGQQFVPEKAANDSADDEAETSEPQAKVSGGGKAGSGASC
jgi:ribonuclease E